MELPGESVTSLAVMDQRKIVVSGLSCRGASVSTLLPTPSYDRERVRYFLHLSMIALSRCHVM